MENKKEPEKRIKYKTYSFKLNEKTKVRLNEKYTEARSWNILFMKLLESDDIINKK